MQGSILAALGIAPDLDLLIGAHRAETHSIGAAALVACLAAWWRWPIAETRWRIGCAAFLAWASHPLLDAFGSDNAMPFGTMALWPFTRDYFIAGWALFLPITRRWNSAMFLVANGLAVIRELLVLGPIAGAVWWFRRR